MIVGFFQWMAGDIKRLRPKLPTEKKRPQVVHIIAGVSALMAFIFTHRIFNAAPNPLFGVFKRVTIDWQWQLIYLIPVGIAVGLLVGMYFNLTDQVTKNIVTRLPLTPGLKPVINGLMLGLAGVYAKELLFSGQQQLVTIFNHVTVYSIGSLLILGLVKPILTNIGFHLGWRGGTIFPAMLSSFLLAAVLNLGLGLHSVLFMLTVSLAAVVYITGSPVVMMLVYMLLYPVTMYVPIILLALATDYVVKRLRKINHRL
ncbi:hypothetical protein EFS06_02070 [Levilactobacillus brevis]|nr:hypothetical protein [Levilactobacillus brevis]